MPETWITTAPVVIYDILCEARNRLLGTYNVREADDEKVVEFALTIDERVAAVALDDLDAQRALTAAFSAERDALRQERRPT
ncbi:MAG: hypothetical protein DI536_36425 [Archangium gephyra]|uniref:Uncharacterized protein n=1 Tax=Archangium gephyra TaxID=48 RepID=A0A2W5SQI7_9BACT|nr:MAG: hypothetical protein DI536_36425 [Archangium gephyra]